MERPSTSDAVIESHEKAFDFFGGYPKEVVYDQDKILLTAKNAGNLVLTDAFRAYQQECPFQLHFCRKNDPQSKGKIENVIISCKGINIFLVRLKLVNL
jgi:transposase